MIRTETCSWSLCNKLYISIPTHSCVRQVHTYHNTDTPSDVNQITVNCNRAEHDVVTWTGDIYYVFIYLFIHVNGTRKFSNPEQVSSASIEITTYSKTGVRLPIQILAIFPPILSSKWHRYSLFVFPGLHPVDTWRRPSHLYNLELKNYKRIYLVLLFITRLHINDLVLSMVGWYWTLCEWWPGTCLERLNGCLLEANSIEFILRKHLDIPLE